MVQLKRFVIFLFILSLIGLTGCTETQKGGEAAPAGWKLQFSDDFSRKQLGKDWMALKYSEWSIKKGWLTLDEGGSGEIVCTKKFAGDQRVEFDAQSDNPCDLTCILSTDEEGHTNGYFVGFGSNNNAYSKLLIQGYEVKTWDTVIKPGKVHHQVVQKKGNTITHTVDGKTVMTYKHSMPLEGEDHQMIGFYIYTSGKIDNVKVYTKK
ncbi:MAG: hypothetical protein ACYSSI_14365 [Planctomycetota bacterium]|jgi:hypothetical protein